MELHPLTPAVNLGLLISAQKQFFSLFDHFLNASETAHEKQCQEHQSVQ